VSDPVQIQEAELTTRRGTFAEALAGELSARLGRTLELSADPPRKLGVLELATNDEALVHQKLRFRSGDGVLHVLLPKAGAALFAALERGASGDALAAALQSDPDADALAALAQMMESVADVLGRSFASAGLPALAVDEARVVANAQSDPTWIDDALYVRLRVSVASEGSAAWPLDFVFHQSDVARGSAAPRSMCFIEGGDEVRKRASALEAALGLSAATLDPSELARPFDERLLDARMIVIPWDLAGRSGLEIAESLARDPRLAQAKLVLGTPRPTRARVAAALRAGASAVVADWFDAESLAAIAAQEEGAQ
jgi:CheY-like chemotaxis protein